jgi:hypothetical protein
MTDFTKPVRLIDEADCLDAYVDVVGTRIFGGEVWVAYVAKRKDSLSDGSPRWDLASRFENIPAAPVVMPEEPSESVFDAAFKELSQNHIRRDIKSYYRAIRAALAKEQAK